MSLRTDPESGSMYGRAYESDQFERPVDRGRVRLQVMYFVDRCGPQVLVSCPWGLKLATHGAIGQAVIIPRREWDRMLAALAQESA